MTTEKETALVTIEPVNALAIFTTPEKVDPILEAIRKVVSEFEPDVTTAKGRKEIASIAHKVAQSKTYLDGIGNKLNNAPENLLVLSNREHNSLHAQSAHKTRERCPNGRFA